MALELTVDHIAPEVVSLVKAKKQMRFDDAEAEHLEDDLIYVYIEAAVKYAENFIESEISEKKYEIRGKSFKDALSFSRQKVQAIDVIKYKDIAGELKTVEAANYHLETVDKYETKIVFNEDYILPEVKQFTPDAVTLFVTVGYAAGKVPKDIIVAVLMLASSYNEKREDSIKDKRTAAENLLQPYRKY